MTVNRDSDVKRARVDRSSFSEDRLKAMVATLTELLAVDTLPVDLEEDVLGPSRT